MSVLVSELELVLALELVLVQELEMVLGLEWELMSALVSESMSALGSQQQRQTHWSAWERYGPSTCYLVAGRYYAPLSHYLEPASQALDSARS